MSVVSRYSMPLFGGLLICIASSVLVFGFDFWVIRLIETTAELAGLLQPGWADTHMPLTLKITMLVTAPVSLLIFVAAWRKILAVEMDLASASMQKALSEHTE